MRKLYIIPLKKVKWTFIILCASFFAAFFLYLELQDSTDVFSNKNEPAALHAGDSKDSSIALTFNISHGDQQLPSILKTLEKQKTTATFFITGEWAERHPDLLDAISEAQHEIGMLGYQYVSYLEQDAANVQRDIIKAKEAFQKLGYEDVYLLRPPNGHFNEEVIKLAEQQGLKVIHWSINSNDWKNPGTEKITKLVLDETKKGDILLFHASDTVKYTSTALEQIIPNLKDRKLNLTTVSELISQAKVKDEQLTTN